MFNRVAALAIAGMVMAGGCTRVFELLDTGEQLPAAEIPGGDEMPAQGAPREAVSFLPPVTFTTSSPGLDLLALEVSGDQRVDLFSPSLGGGLAALANQSTPGTIMFAQLDLTVPDGQITAAAAARFDADTLPELFLLYNDGGLKVMRQLVGGGFSQLHHFDGVNSGVFMLDYANSTDQVLDLLLPNEEERQLECIWFLSPESVHRPHPLNLGTTDRLSLQNNANYVQLVACDIDGSGLPTVHLVDALNHTITAFSHSVGQRPKYIFVGDTPGDVILSDPNNPYPAQTTDYYPQTSELFAGHEPQRISFGDLNADGLKDLAVVTFNEDGRVFTNAGIGMPFTATGQGPSTYVALYETSIEGEAGNPDARRDFSYTFRTLLYFPGKIHDAVLFDANNDGLMDVAGVTEGARGFGSYMFYYPGAGNFNFSTAVGYPLSAPGFRLQVADFDGDLFQDIAALMPTSNVVAVYRNNGASGIDLVGQQFPLE